MYYTKHFPTATVTPKMHMMLKHLPSQISKWKFAMGFLGEQGAESIHSSFNSIERIFSGIPNKVDFLLRVMKEHHLRVEPENLVLKPPEKKRKLDKEKQ